MEITREQFRERAREKVKSLEFSITQTAFADSRAELEEELELARIALVSLEAEAVAWKITSAQGTFIGISSEPLDYDAVKYYEQKVEPLYSAPPAPVAVPDDVSGPLAHAYKELTPTFMRNHIDVFERYGIYPDGSAGIQAMRIALDGMSRRAAMLQGAGGNSPVIPDGGEHGFCQRHPDTRRLTHPYKHLSTYPPRPSTYCPKCDPEVAVWVELDKQLRKDN